MNNSQLLCKDCRHSFVPLTNWIFSPPKYRYSCRKSLIEDQTVHNPVTGDEHEARRYQSCAVFRMGNSHARNCGTDAYYWEPKSKKDLFKLIAKNH